MLLMRTKTRRRKLMKISSKIMFISPISRSEKSQLGLYYWFKIATHPSTCKHAISGNYRSASDTPSGWRFAGRPRVARDGMLAALLFL